MILRAASLLVVLSWAAHSTYGESITILAGTVFHEVKVLRLEPDGINIDHSGGLAKILFSELPPDVQLKYGYDPERAARYSQKVLEARRARQAYHAQQAQAKAQAQAQAAAAAFPVDVFDIVAVKDRGVKEISGISVYVTDSLGYRHLRRSAGGLYRVRFSLKNRTESDLTVIVQFGDFQRQVYVPARSRREREEISGDESYNEIFVTVGGQQKAFSLR